MKKDTFHISGYNSLCKRVAAIHKTVNELKSKLTFAPEPICNCKERGQWFNSTCPKHPRPVRTPLRAQVAKALGKEIMFSDGGLWYLKTGTHPNQWESIADYPNDIKLAMRALGELRGSWQLNIYGGGSIEVVIGISDAKTYRFDMSQVSLSEAICQAIVKHKEENL